MWWLFYIILLLVKFIAFVWVYHMQKQLKELRIACGVAAVDNKSCPVYDRLKEAVDSSFAKAFKEAQISFIKDIDDIKRIVNQHEFVLAKVSSGKASNPIGLV